MLAIVHKDWVAMPGDRQVAVLKKLKPEMLCSFVRRIEPMKTDISVLRWIAAQQDIDLGTALTLFFNFEPARINLYDRENLPNDLRDYCAVMDVLCQRINCGFYIPIASRKLENPALLVDWLHRQDLADETARPGRWKLSAAIVRPMIAERKPRSFGGRGNSPRPGFIQGLFTPLFVSNKH